ncbi:MAG TPA: porphobilinogen synthase [Gemmatimonadales bacterium]|nr:porphobilinogen synthase [Gemmatimonadota bacterium]MCB9505108.1 porphobilinogen synthase [Gemmatimonadales bacterium]HPF60584.1 porphobilinogen synthase [Gemmatimonadales bacterium]HRX18860.1 porphobilinogen synthase [Gemmatimonadales bacterium]
MDPIDRPRRLRRSPALRALVRETRLVPAQLIAPLFVVHGSGVRRAIASMPGQYHLSVDESLDRTADDLVAAGVGGVILFGIPAAKDPIGTENWSPDGIVARAIGRLKARHPALLVFTDVCCCEYTDHGHCGILTADGVVDNDATLEVLGQVAVAHAAAGADVLAPSGMMDGMVAAIRDALDAAGFADRAICSYAVKYASAYYGPFREAVESAPAFGDRRSYQMDPANRREARREADLDEAEGADMLMVKPALAYLDVIREVRDRSDLPVLCYNVSGEYAMVKAAAAQGWLDERAVVLETLLAMRRAGADAILTYHALDAARWLREDA